MLKLLLLSTLLVALVLSQNPFSRAPFYVNPSYQAELDTSIATATGQTKVNLQKMRNVASAYWLDVKAKITGSNTTTAEGILADSAKMSPPHLVVFIVYDLPNRDCHAKASNGEICCTKNSDGTCDYNAGGDCSAGINEYKTQYIDPLVTVLKKYANTVPIALVIEPDSLPNLATNMGDPHCGNSATTNAYKTGIPYAINAISAAVPNIPMYVDAAHGGWLGWDDNLQKFVQLISSMNIASKIRGFSTNVANYQPIGIQCPYQRTSGGSRNDYCLNNQHQSDPCCSDPCRLEGQWNPGNNELNYIQDLAFAFSSAIPGFSPKFIIDSGRNGVANMRADCANWCNIRGAGVGLMPTVNTANTTLVDAYYWLKTPGESDGCTQTLPNGQQCARFDSMCGSEDSLGSKSGEPRAPEAGKWFDYQVKMLADNAHFD
eukprot:TRINITY_DN4219_c0_g1_i1.p1 TRINITY_DN4219_c0_g1~~TRINITY_DN4219_c0_g1_i1.p1  ORF type:complete len:443 (+),score=93.65 TRINITY_DN4219_c0_g1_i1:34-1329(+)